MDSESKGLQSGVPAGDTGPGVGQAVPSGAGDGVNAPIWQGMVLAGGPPRSGTTLLAQLLNVHPRIALAHDNSVFESWGLYHYGPRVGLVQRLRSGGLEPGQAQSTLWNHLVRHQQVWGVAPSASTIGYPQVPPPARPGASRSMVREVRRWLVTSLRAAQAGKGYLPRHRLPVELFPDTLWLALKSPEIVYVLPELAAAFPQARFVLVHRPAFEVAESMYRKGIEWKLASFQRRWREEIDGEGNLVPPPGIPAEWHGLWRTTSDLGRCTVYVTSYLRAMAEALPEIEPDRIFVYDHTLLRVKPTRVLAPLASFLGVGYDGFVPSADLIHPSPPQVTADSRAEIARVERLIDAGVWVARIEAFLEQGGQV